jgi:hypothetical protein
MHHVIRITTNGDVVSKQPSSFKSVKTHYNTGQKKSWRVAICSTPCPAAMLHPQWLPKQFIRWCTSNTSATLSQLHNCQCLRASQFCDLIYLLCSLCFVMWALQIKLNEILIKEMGNMKLVPPAFCKFLPGNWRLSLMHKHTHTHTHTYVHVHPHTHKPRYIFAPKKACHSLCMATKHWKFIAK